MDDLMNIDACTLPTEQRPARQAEFDSLFVESVSGVERQGDVVRLHLIGSAGLRDRVRDLAQRETACCSFFTFTIEGPDDSLILSVTVPSERRDILAALAARATELAA